MSSSTLEQVLLAQLLWAGLPRPEEEFRFHPKRKWRFDFAWEDRLLAVEVEGGTWVSGRHSRGAGFARDCEKYAHAAARGWRVVRLTTDMIEARTGVELVKEAYLWSR